MYARLHGSGCADSGILRGVVDGRKIKPDWQDGLTGGKNSGMDFGMGFQGEWFFPASGRDIFTKCAPIPMPLRRTKRVRTNTFKYRMIKFCKTLAKPNNIWYNCNVDFQNQHTERYRSGHNGADSKSVCEQSHMGSNPILSANGTLENPVFSRVFSIRWKFFRFYFLCFCRFSEPILCSFSPVNIRIKNRQIPHEIRLFKACLLFGALE